MYQRSLKLGDKYIMSTQSIKKGICDAFSNVDVAGSFSCLDAYSTPALSIQGLGTISLTLSDRDAQAIAESSATQQSPTLVDTNVRKSWQIDPQDFQLRNPHFSFQINHVITKTVVN